MIIRTDRLILRPFETEDFCWFKEVAMNEEVGALLPGIACGNDRAIGDTIALYIKGDFKNDFYFVICGNNGNSLGIIIATRTTSVIVDVSYFLKKEFRHQGYMKEAVREFVKQARKVCELYKFRFVIAGYNNASLNVVKSLGATVNNVCGHYVCYL